MFAGQGPIKDTPRNKISSHTQQRRRHLHRADLIHLFHVPGKIYNIFNAIIINLGPFAMMLPILPKSCGEVEFKIL